MASNLYNKGLHKIVKGPNHPDGDFIDYLNDTIKVLILSPTGASAFDVDNEFVADVDANEVTNSSGTGYERKTLASKTVLFDEANDRVEYDADNPTYTAISTNEDLAGAVIFKDTGDDATSPLIAFIEFADLSTNGSDVELQINADGLFTITNNIT